MLTSFPVPWPHCYSPAYVVFISGRSVWIYFMSSKTLLTTFSFSHRLFEHMDCGFGSLAMDSHVSSGCCGGFILLLTQGFLAPGILTGHQRLWPWPYWLSGVPVSLSLPEPCPEIWQTSLETVASSRSSVGSSRSARQVWGLPWWPSGKEPSC